MNSSGGMIPYHLIHGNSHAHYDRFSTLPYREPADIYPPFLPMRIFILRSGYALRVNILVEPTVEAGQPFMLPAAIPPISCFAVKKAKIIGGMLARTPPAATRL